MRLKITIGICLLMVAAGTCFLKVQGTPAITRANTPPDLAGSAVQDMPAIAEDDFFAKMLDEAKAKLPSDYILTQEDLEQIRKSAVPRALDMVAKSESLRKAISQLLERPVELYGQVLDESEMPVVGAKIEYHAAPGGPVARIFSVMSSAPDGRFEVKDLNAVALTLVIEPPPGYQRPSEYIRKIPISEPLEVIQHSEEYKKLPQAAQLAVAPLLAMSRPDSPTYKTDKSKPVIFRLRKL